ncbi:cysteine synthase A [Calorimonas adulescens]|jgi:cystathionine beta-synthase (acetylserine-dependent) (EC 4.2.1.-)|uniref:Cysteine synthase n=1 Tax=Calorimonas adulescens TaxID=2606906 RepID=A0A5D8QFY8_9THEO|nr:cysteine synthase A [Calorimonas adulescens]TZE82443.1 cysteine synthase A [Calorimonas adulescens]
MGYYNDIREIIGKTPLLKLNHLDIPHGVNIFAKLEYLNPGGSVKDRTCLYIIKEAEEEGLIRPGSTIIEPTAGNTGIGLAMACLNKDYRLILVVPTKFSVEKQQLMRALGAEIINTPREDGMMGALKKAEELAAQIPASFIPNQFANPANPKAHYETTGPEIWDDLDGDIDAVVMGAGTGGTFTGVMRYLKERRPEIKGVLADPVGSIIGGGDIKGCYKIEGIGNDFIPETMDISLIDHVEKICDEEAFAMVSELARKEGLTVGSSSGANVCAALKYAKIEGRGNIVVILPDRSDRYFSEGIYGLEG